MAHVIKEWFFSDIRNKTINIFYIGKDYESCIKERDSYHHSVKFNQPTQEQYLGEHLYYGWSDDKFLKFFGIEKEDTVINSTSAIDR